MADFTLDTSGEVPANDTPRAITASAWRWSDLSPFEQGTATEALRAAWLALDADTREGMERGGFSMAFTDFAPETLAAIRKDCAGFQEWRRLFPARPGTTEMGRLFWGDRQRDCFKEFPPLTPYLDDAGKVLTRPA